MTTTAPLPLNEAERLVALQELCLLDTPDDPAFDQMTLLAAKVFGAPIALISLVDERRQWFKSRIGLDTRETPRSQAFCAYALQSNDPLVVLDTWLDDRFITNPLVTGFPKLRFYAGAPLITRSGLSLGTFCIMGKEPRQNFDDTQIDQLRHFARLAMLHIENLRRIGFIDPLTQLPNRSRFLDDVALWILDAQAGGKPLFAVAIDVCDASYFRQMLAALGSEYTDGYLLSSARSIVGTLSPTPVYRLDTTVFSCVLSASDDEAMLRKLCDMQAKLSVVVEHQGIPHASQIVVGAVAVATDHGSNDISRALRSALRHARVKRLPTTLYQSQLDAAQQRAFRILSAIPAALASGGQLELYYQPRQDLHTGICTGCEALLRWNHPELGEVSPAEFIPLAEKTALIRDITAWVLRSALAQAERWQRVGHRFSVSLNVSARDLDDDSFVDLLTVLLGLHHLDPSLVEIEFTESAMVGDPLAVHRQLMRIRALGLQIAIDDFGAGYSNLAYLKQIPATTLKIDKSFLRSLPASMSDINIICSIIRLGHDFGYRVLAEGIESDQVYELLSSWGCDEGQGYWIARPMPAGQMIAWLCTNQNFKPAKS